MASSSIRPEPLATREEPGVGEALERVLDESQALLVRRLELLVEHGRDLLGSSLIAGAGVLVALAGWWLLVFAALAALPDERTRIIAAFAVGAAHVAGGVLVARRALDRGGDSS